MATIKEGDKVKIHCPSKILYDNKVGKVHHVWDLDRNPWGNIVVIIEDNHYQNCFLEEELELLKGEITMATITEDYVSFETAKLLKEKGFDGVSTIMYKENGEMCINPKSVVSWRLKYWYPCLTLQMAMKWLREVHKISIEITSTGYLIDNDVYWECDIKAGHRLYFRHITNEESFESCAEAAIKYCLENLI